MVSRMAPTKLRLHRLTVLGTTQRNISESANLAQCKISELELGLRDGPSKKHYPALARAYKLPLAKFKAMIGVKE